MICDYGCGEEAIYQFKNGKWCCSKSTNSCPFIKKELSEKNKEKFFQKNIKRKFHSQEKENILEKIIQCLVVIEWGKIIQCLGENILKNLKRK